MFPKYLLIVMLGLSTIACGGKDTSVAESPPVPTPPITTPPSVPNTPALCINTPTSINWDALMQDDCPELAQYGLFIDPSQPTSLPRLPGQKYELATQLFTDYASKYRFVFIPNGQKMTYVNQGVFSLPVGSVLVKTFALPADTQVTGIENETLIETRLLIHRQNGWTALAYQWKNTQATLAVAGANVPHTLNNQGETLQFDYHIPSRAECKLCHQANNETGSDIIPIGLKAHLLNRDVNPSGAPLNQLQLWSTQGLLQNMPAINDVPKTYAIDDEQGDLTARAKGYLDINCAHCHSAAGFASISGLRLGFDVDHTSYQYGVCKQPPGWDGGEKGLSYDIVPGNAEHSILLYRQELLAPKDRMPPIGRNLVHYEGVELIRRWLDQLSPSLGNCN